MLNEAVIRVLCACFSARIKQKRSLAFASDLGALEGTRTPDLLIRSQTLYPAELPARNVYYNTIHSPKCQAFFQKKFLRFLLLPGGRFWGVWLAILA